MREKKKVLLETARRCSELLKREYGAREVILIGSLALPGPIHERSDIDLAVWGLPGPKYIRAVCDLYKLLPPGVDLDLIPLEDAYPSMLEFVEESGVQL